MASSHQIVIRSSVAGRLRFEVPSLLDSPLVCAFLNQELPREPGVLSISASAVTGRVLLIYGRPFSPASLEAVVKRALTQAEHSLAAPAVTDPALCELPTPPHPLVQLHAHTRRHEGQIVLAMVVAFLNKLLESAPAAMLGSATDVITGGNHAKFWTRLGFRTVRSQLFALGGVSLAVWSLTSLMGFLHR